MADISKLLRISNGVARQVDLSANNLVVGGLKTATYTLTDLILGRLLSLQDGSDVAATYHTHDSRYFTESELGSSSASSGSDLIGDDNTYSNFTPSAATVKGALAGIDSALASAGGVTFSDSIFRIYDNGDNTKNIAFEASSITTATTRTITMPDANVSLADVNNAILKDGSRAFTANQSLGTFKLTSVGDPTSAQDAATKAYVDAVALGLKPKKAVRVASLANVVIASALESGDSLDGITLATGDRVLLKDQTAPAENGIYVVVASGAASRSSDFDSLSPIDEINGAWVPVQEGTQAGRVYVQYGAVAVLDTDPINFEFYNPIASLIGGDMVTVSGSTISVDLATVSGLESSNPGNAAGQLRVKLEASNPSLQIDGSNQLGSKLDGAGAITSGASGIKANVDGTTLEINTNAIRVKDAGVSLAKLASDSVDENKIVSTALSSTGGLTGGSSAKLAWNPDNSTLELNANAARVKDAGVTAAKLSSNVFDQLTITGGAGSAGAVQNSPQVKKTLVAGEAFAANTSFLVRWAIDSLGETADRVYKADKDASTTDKFLCVGIAHSTSAVSAGQNIDVVILGSHTLGSSDTAFGAGDVGKALWLTTAGAFSVTAPSAANEADFRIGIVEATSKIWVDKQMMGIN